MGSSTPMPPGSFAGPAGSLRRVCQGSPGATGGWPATEQGPSTAVAREGTRAAFSDPRGQWRKPLGALLVAKQKIGAGRVPKTCVNTSTHCQTQESQTGPDQRGDRGSGLWFLDLGVVPVFCRVLRVEGWNLCRRDSAGVSVCGLGHGTPFLDSGCCWCACVDANMAVTVGRWRRWRL
jgi:hypothetical protein